MHYLIGAIGSVVANGSRPVVKLGQRDRVGFHPSMQIRDVASLLLVLLCNTGTSAPVFPRATTCKTPPDPHFVLKGTSGRQSPSPLEAAVVGDLPNVHFCYFGIWQVVLCFEVAGECSVQGRLFFFFTSTFAISEAFLMLWSCLFLVVGHQLAQDHPTFVSSSPVMQLLSVLPPFLYSPPAQMVLKLQPQFPSGKLLGCLHYASSQECCW